MIDVNFFRKLSLLLIFSALMAIADFVCGEEKYNPYPIIFVHGYNNVRAVNERIDNLWFKPRDTLKEFLVCYPNWPWKNPEKFKYLNEDWDNYMAFFDYRAESNGDINDIADKLGDYIDKIIDKLPSDQEKKVIIVAHSMGGLVTRRLLAKDNSYRDKIERVIFIGTPHLGTPQASGVILSDRMIPALESLQAEHHKWTGIDRNLDINWQLAVNADRDRQITDALNLFHGIVNYNFVVNIKDQLDGDKTKRNPYDPPPGADSIGRYNPYVLHHQGQGVAVGQLVVRDSIAATKIFVSSAYSTTTRAMVETEPLIAEPFYNQGDTFLNNNNNPLAQPNNFKTIAGSASLTAPILGIGGDLFKLSADYSVFPPGNSFDDLNAGDGIVTYASQTALGGTIYRVPASHTEEVNHPVTSTAILQAIDDKPVIDNVRLISLHDASGYYVLSTYLVVKVKDYLLADVEFELNGINAQNLDEYRDPVTGKYKPYIKGAENKEFLKERDVFIGDEANNTKTSLHLLPGEFYLKLSGFYPAGSIKIRNAADKETECQIISPAGYFAKFKHFAAAMNIYRSRYPPYNLSTDLGEWALPYSAFRDYTYNSFLSDSLWFSTDDNVHPPGDYPGGGISACIHAYGWWETSGSYNGYANSARRTMIAYAEDHHFINFPLDTSGKTIRTAKVSGYLRKELNGGGADFNMEIYRDSTNTWPVSQNSSGDIPLFSIDTSLYQDHSDFETTIDAANINPNGYNVWETRSDLIEFALHNNLFPESIPNDLNFTYFGPSMWAHFKRSAYIGYPVLIIIYE